MPDADVDINPVPKNNLEPSQWTLTTELLNLSYIWISKKTVDSIWLKIMCPLLEKFTYFSRGLFSLSIFLGSWRDLVTDLVMIINYIQLVP